MKSSPSGLTGRLQQRLHSLLLLLRVPDKFWSLWGARVIGTVMMSAIVALCLKPFETGVREFVDANVQMSLLARLGHADKLPPVCAGRTLDCISVIGIDDAEHRNIFQQRSPLDPDKLRELFDALQSAPPKVLAIDLDLSPAAPDEWPARRRLFESLQKLSRLTQLVMVCPQGYTGGDPGALDQDWLALFGSEVQFASPDLSENGLYFDRGQGLTPLGVAAAELSREPVQAQRSEAKDWHAACLGARDSAHGPELRVIRPAAVESLNFSQALLKPDALAGRLVLLGGKWGTGDQFLLRGQSESFYGVGLHAWVAATELSPLFEPPKVAELVIEVLVGLLSGLYFAAVWAAIVHSPHSFARRSFYYLCFLGGALIFPLAWVMTTARLAELGVVLGTAGMILSAAADSFLSAHEGYLETEHEEVEADAEAEGEGASGRPVWVYGLAWGSGAALLGLTLLHGESWLACLAAGAALGLLIARFDATAPEHGAEPVLEPRHPDLHPESLLDLFARLFWLLIKLAALWLAMSHAHGHEAWAIWALFGGFVLSWSLALALTRARARHGLKGSESA
ncbi:CHASE2 domain-containing protein [Paucibacter sp. B2R-40]|uniref:CHASE2 domain-containing protein n=1 Tax=Paucibacter sp. B2R-40 TaxID=2893554 RepID=UPI0021E3C1FB|nr:CHASE2 domain-containing protein [Paucibacter sp. B2R-40]MCV2353683.1 CHASE2 domain-containing protein [Paucibacter sp. B2R-40]